MAMHFSLFVKQPFQHKTMSTTEIIILSLYQYVKKNRHFLQLVSLSFTNLYLKTFTQKSFSFTV